MFDHSSLRIWKDSKALFLEVHQLSYHSFFERDRYLKSQLLRASLSVHLNISEGSGRGRTKEFIHFLRISRGSLEETISLLLILEDLVPSTFPTNDLVSRYKRLHHSINSLMAKIKTADTSRS
jgi:four helix bundle protein